MRAGTLKADEEAAREEIVALRSTVAALEAQAATAKTLLKENADMREKIEGLKARERAGDERVEMLEQQGGHSINFLLARELDQVLARGLAPVLTQVSIKKVMYKLLI